MCTLWWAYVDNYGGGRVPYPGHQYTPSTLLAAAATLSPGKAV